VNQQKQLRQIVSIKETRNKNLKEQFWWNQDVPRFEGTILVAWNEA
jgi:hypothetical protein